jgi:hypothetical protein
MSPRHLTRGALTVVASLLSAALSAQQPKQILPAAEFNEQEARAALEPGTATLRGVASTKGNALTYNKLFKRYYAREGATITLFPRTAYFDEWYALRQKIGRDPTQVAVMSPKAMSYRVVAKVIDNNGTFEFRNLKPGKYYLEAVIQFTQTISEKVETGQRLNSNGFQVFVEPIYTRFTHSYADRNYVQEFAEIPSGGSVIEVKLQ